MSESTGPDNKKIFDIRRAITVNAPRNVALLAGFLNIRHAANPDRAQAKPQKPEASEALPLQQLPHIEGMCNHGGPFNRGLTQKTLTLFKKKALSDQANYNARGTQGEEPVHMERKLPDVEVVKVPSLDALQNIFYQETLDTNGFDLNRLLHGSPLELKNRRNQIATEMNLKDGQMTISYVLTDYLYNHMMQTLPLLNVKSVAEYFTAHAYVGNKMLSDAKLNVEQIVRKIYILPDSEMINIVARPLKDEDPNSSDIIISNWRQYDVTDISGNTRQLLLSGKDHQLVGFPYKSGETKFYPYTSSYLVDIFVPELGKVVKIDIGAIHEWVYHQTFYNCADEYHGTGWANVTSRSEQNPFLQLDYIFNMYNSIGSNLEGPHSGIIPLDAEIARLFSQIHPDWRGYMSDFIRDYRLINQGIWDFINSVTEAWPYAINLSVASPDGSISKRDSGTNKVSAFFVITDMTNNPTATSARVDPLFNNAPDSGIFTIQPQSLAYAAGAENLYNPNNGSFNVRHIGIQIGDSGVVIPIPSEAVNMATFCSRYTENGSIDPNFNNVLKWTLILYKDFDTIQLPSKHSMYIYNLPFEPDEDDSKSSSIYASMKLGEANYLIWSINPLDISGLTPKQTFKEYIPVGNTQIQ